MYLREWLRYFVFTTVIAGFVSPVAAHAEDWVTFGKTAQRQGYNGQETSLSEQTVHGLHQLWHFTMNGPILTQPLLASGIAVDDGTGTGKTVLTDLVYVADMTGLVAAFDAGGSGMAWSSQLPALPTFCPDFPTGVVGIIGTPTIDKALNRMWVVAADGSLWALALDTGLPLPGYPLQIIDPDNADGQTINYGGLNYSDGSLYVPTGGQCDEPPYHGQLIKVAVGTAVTAVPQVAARWYPSGAAGPDGGGIWGFGGVSIEADGSYLYAATGNALVTPENAGYADQVIKLDTSLQPVAANAPSLIGADLDFGATPLLYQPTDCPAQMVVMNKSGALFLFNRASSDITAGPLQRIQVTRSAENGNFIGLPAFDPVSQQLYLGSPWDDVSWQYSHGLLAFGVSNGCALTLQWQQTIGLDVSQSPNNPMIPPVVANGVVYYSTGAASSVFAYTSKGNYLWDSGQQIVGGIIAAPTVVNGMLLVADYSGNLTAFGP